MATGYLSPCYNRHIDYLVTGRLFVCYSRHTGLMVDGYLSVGTVSLTKWLKRPPRQRKIPGSIHACAGIFPGSSHTSDLKIGTPVATLQGACVIGTVQGLVGPVSVYCNWVRWKVWSATSISVWQHVKLSEQIRPLYTLSCRCDIKQPTNNLFVCYSRHTGCMITSYLSVLQQTHWLHGQWLPVYVLQQTHWLHGQWLPVCVTADTLAAWSMVTCLCYSRHTDCMVNGYLSMCYSRHTGCMVNVYLSMYYSRHTCHMITGYLSMCYSRHTDHLVTGYLFLYYSRHIDHMIIGYLSMCYSRHTDHLVTGRQTHK